MSVTPSPSASSSASTHASHSASSGASPSSATSASGTSSGTADRLPSRYLQVMAYYHAQPGMGDRVSELLGELTTATRQEPKNLGYEFYRSPQDPDRFVILERYTDASGLDDHRASAHFQRLGFGTIIPMLVSRRVESFDVITSADGAATATPR